MYNFATMYTKTRGHLVDVTLFDKILNCETLCTLWHTNFSTVVIHKLFSHLKNCYLRPF